MKIDYAYLNANVIGSNEPDDLDLDEAEAEVGTLKYKLTVPQSQFDNLTCANPLFIGGYGSGKTTIKVIQAMKDLTQFPGANIALYDPTFDQIGLNTAPRLEEMLQDLNLKYNYNQKKQTIKVEGYGMFILRSMNNPERIVGYEVFRSHVDEIGVVHPNHVEDVWNKIVARNRQKIYVFDKDDKKVIDIKTKKPLMELNRISAYGTPDDGYGFTYNMWGKDPADGYEYVRAPTHSNVDGLPEGYVEQLKKIYPSGLVDAFIEGFWTNFTSGTVYYAFDRDIHSTPYTVAEGEQLHIGMDFNVYNMAAVVGVVRRGVLYIVDEFIGLRDTPDMIRQIRERYPDNNVIVYPDATGKAVSSKNSSLSDHKLLRDAKFKIKARASNPLIRDRVQSVNAAWENGNVKVNIETCPSVVESQEQQTYDKNGMPDKKSGLDHTNDGAGYLINWMFGIKRPRVLTTGVKTV